MNAGKLRHRITIQAPIERENDYGERAVTWIDFASVGADIRPLSGRELVMAQQIESLVTTSIQMRFYPGLNPKMRIVYAGRIFEIASIINILERNRELNILCHEVVADG